MAWIQHFMINCRAQQTVRISGELTTKEFIDAELLVLKLSQGESFNENESRFNTLDTFKDECGLIRLKSLVINRDDEYNFRCPIVLDPKHPLIKMLSSTDINNFITREYRL